jgi:hypothetical protein
MQRKNLIASAALAVAAFGAIPATASAQEILTGDTRLACEAILCLASWHPARANARRRFASYFSITYAQAVGHDPEAASQLPRTCVPVVEPDAGNVRAGVGHVATALAVAMPQSLNANAAVFVDRATTMARRTSATRCPDYCAAYTDARLHRLQRAPSRAMSGRQSGAGIGSKRADYDRALAEYNERIKARGRRAPPRFSWGGGGN